MVCGSVTYLSCALIQSAECWPDLFLLSQCKHVLSTRQLQDVRLQARLKVECETSQPDTDVKLAALCSRGGQMFGVRELEGVLILIRDRIQPPHASASQLFGDHTRVVCLPPRQIQHSTSCCISRLDVRSSARPGLAGFGNQKWTGGTLHV